MRSVTPGHDEALHGVSSPGLAQAHLPQVARRDDPQLMQSIGPDDEVGAHMQQPVTPGSDGRAGRIRLRHLGETQGWNRAPGHSAWRSGTRGKVGTQHISARGRHNAEAADGQTDLAGRQHAQVGPIRIGRPTQRTQSVRSDQEPQSAFGRPGALGKAAGGGGRQAARADPVHSRVTPGRCPTSWPSTYSAPSGAPASA